MAYFPHAFQKMLLATHATPFRGNAADATANRTTLDILAGQLAIINAKNNKILDLAAAASYTATPLVYLAQGSTHPTDKIGSFHGGYQETVKSKGINPKYVSAFYVAMPSSPVANKVAVKQINSDALVKDTFYRLRVDVKGSPALRTMARNLYHYFDADTVCETAAAGEIAKDKLVTQWAANINAHDIMNKFISATVEYKYDAVAYGAGTKVGFDASADATKEARLVITAAYTDTTFGECSFDVHDHYELEPLQIYTSILDDRGQPCAPNLVEVTTLAEAKQGSGYGETIVRELILDKRYRQEPFQADPRMREILHDTTLTDVPKSGKYISYYILHSIPVAANPSSTMNADQYLIKIVVPEARGRNTPFETYFQGLLAAAGNPVTLDVR
jgi:hypothetical protein